MATYSLADVVDAIEATLSAAPSLARSQSFNEMTEGIHRPDTPLLQTYPEENTGTSGFSDTDRISLSGKHSLKQYLIHADLYATPRSSIGEDMKRLVKTIDELEDILDNQSYPCFGVDCITSFQWSWRRVVFSYAGTEFMGARFSIKFVAGSGGG